MLEKLDLIRISEITKKQGINTQDKKTNVAFKPYKDYQKKTELNMSVVTTSATNQVAK